MTVTRISIIISNKIIFFLWLSLPFDIIPAAEEADEVTEQ